MREFEFLFVVAQVAMTLAGFSALFLILSGRDDGNHGAAPTLSNLERKTRTGTLKLSLIVVLFALLPFLPEYAGLAPEWSWRILSGVFCLVWLVYLLLNTPKKDSEGIDAQMAVVPVLRVYTEGNRHRQDAHHIGR